MNDLVCLSCDAVNESEFYRDGVCGNCQTLADTAKACPLGDGGFDCTPFCPSCEGAQFINGTVKFLSDTDESVLELCQTLNEIRLAVSALRIGEWVSALESAGDLLKAHAGDNDLSGMG